MPMRSALKIGAIFCKRSTSRSGASLRIQINVKSDSAGHESCTLDSLDQKAMGLECANVQFSSANFSFGVPVVKGHWEGKLSEDGKSLHGTWSQGSPLALDFSRQQTAITLPPPQPVKYDPAMAPVNVSELQVTLDKDLAGALATGQLAPSTGGGVTIGVVQHGVRRVFSYGTTKPDSIFEIGSVTKTFTGLILGQLVEQHSVTLDEPVRTLLPQGTVMKPAGVEITLVDIATQHSGLPRLPDNLNPKMPRILMPTTQLKTCTHFLPSRALANPRMQAFYIPTSDLDCLGRLFPYRLDRAMPPCSSSRSPTRWECEIPQSR